MNTREGYNEIRERSYTRACLIAYYAVGVCVDFARPDPIRYEKRYYAQGLVKNGLGGSYPGWTSLNADSLEEAMTWAKTYKYWYVSDLDMDIVLNDMRQDEWMHHNACDRSYDSYNNWRLKGIDKEDL